MVASREHSLQLRHPLSNDECTASYFEQMSARKFTQEYQDTRHPVALVVGESGLAANLKYIPEDTIVMMDISYKMCQYLDFYIESLRTADDCSHWNRLLSQYGAKNMKASREYQLFEWERTGKAHPLTDDSAFREAQQLAREKVIVPWQADITNSTEMDDLASELRRLNGTVTFMNLTNLFSCLDPDYGALKAYKNLHKLPSTSEAPILTTGAGITIRPGSAEERQYAEAVGPANYATGPFFGLDNMHRAIMHETCEPLGAVDRRAYIRPDDFSIDILWLIGNALSGARLRK